MSKRTLTKEERELTEKGLKRNKENLELVKQALEATKKHIDFLKVKRDYEDSMRPFNRQNEDREINKTLNGYEAELEMLKEKIEIGEEHLKSGVENKKTDLPAGVG